MTIYNHFTMMWHPRFYPQFLRVFQVRRDPTRVAAGRRHYIFDPTYGGLDGFGLDRCSTGTIKANKIVLSRDRPNAQREYRFRLNEDSSRCYAVIPWLQPDGGRRAAGESERQSGHFERHRAYGGDQPASQPIGSRNERENAQEHFRSKAESISVAPSRPASPRSVPTAAIPRSRHAGSNFAAFRWHTESTGFPFPSREAILKYPTQLSSTNSRCGYNRNRLRNRCNGLAISSSMTTAAPREHVGPASSD